MAQWSQSTPDSPAIIDPEIGNSLTYRELWDRAGWLAADLAAAGVAPGDLVAIDLRRGVDLVIAFVGVVRAGAAYLPLDEQAPAERVRTILAEAEVTVVVAPSTGGRVTVPSVTAVPVRHTPSPVPVPHVHVGGDDTLYVTYTSGSTGRPKGVVVPHRGIVRLVHQPDFCAIAPGDRVANTCNPAFDVIGSEIWGGLTAGATVVAFPSFVDAGIDRWLATIDEYAVRKMFLTTSVFHTVAREQPDGFGGLSDLVLVGEQLDLAATRAVLAAGPPGRLVNGYGPTEASVFASFFLCTDESLAGRTRIPIGHPLAETDLYVLGEGLTPVAPGEVGELCIGGPGVANGYLHHPDVTAERFVAHPADGQLIYRTGDLVRDLGGDGLEFLGRKDRQVKVRGFRVELEEIERAAVATGLVDAAFVELDGEGSAAVLVGLVRPARDVSGSPVVDLTARLLAVLPAYMLPARWIMLNAVPLGPTGKADRKAMARLVREERAAGVVTPVDDPVVAAVLEVVRDELAAAAVTPAANFVELGGNSVQAVRAAHRISRKLNIRLRPVELLSADSIGALVAAISAR